MAWPPTIAQDLQRRHKELVTNDCNGQECIGSGSNVERNPSIRSNRLWHPWPRELLNCWRMSARWAVQRVFCSYTEENLGEFAVRKEKSWISAAKVLGLTRFLSAGSISNFRSRCCSERFASIFFLIGWWWCWGLSRRRVAPADFGLFPPFGWACMRKSGLGLVGWDGNAYSNDDVEGRPPSLFWSLRRPNWAHLSRNPEICKL